jgi:hypothetical protein
VSTSRPLPWLVSVLATSYAYACATTSYVDEQGNLVEVTRANRAENLHRVFTPLRDIISEELRTPEGVVRRIEFVENRPVVITHFEKDGRHSIQRIFYDEHGNEIRNDFYRGDELTHQRERDPATHAVTRLLNYEEGRLAYVREMDRRGEKHLRSLTYDGGVLRRIAVEDPDGQFARVLVFDAEGSVTGEEVAWGTEAFRLYEWTDHAGGGRRYVLSPALGFRAALDPVDGAPPRLTRIDYFKPSHRGPPAWAPGKLGSKKPPPPPGDRPRTEPLRPLAPDDPENARSKRVPRPEDAPWEALPGPLLWSATYATGGDGGDVRTAVEFVPDLQPAVAAVARDQAARLDPEREPSECRAERRGFAAGWPLFGLVDGEPCAAVPVRAVPGEQAAERTFCAARVVTRPPDANARAAWRRHLATCSTEGWTQVLQAAWRTAEGSLLDWPVDPVSPGRGAGDHSP